MGLCEKEEKSKEEEARRNSASSLQRSSVILISLEVTKLNMKSPLKICNKKDLVSFAPAFHL